MTRRPSVPAAHHRAHRYATRAAKANGTYSFVPECSCGWRSEAVFLFRYGAQQSHRDHVVSTWLAAKGELKADVSKAAERVRRLIDRVIDTDALIEAKPAVTATVAAHWNWRFVSVCVRGKNARPASGRIVLLFNGKPLPSLEGSGESPGGYNVYVLDAVEALRLHGFISEAERTAFVDWLNAERKAKNAREDEATLKRLAAQLGYRLEPKGNA